MPPAWPIGDSPDIAEATVGGLYARDAGSENFADASTSLHPNTPNLFLRADSSTDDSSEPKYGKGTVDPHSIKMQGLMALFALIGLAFVIGGIWFFFWAKNGGFVWRKGDWDDYKSTVLRRKGPDGKTLSNATASTKLGGGSIVGKGYTDDGYSFTEGSYIDTATIATEKSRHKRFRETAKEKLLRRNKHEQWEGADDADVRAYRQEKPAQIGGMNREADGTYNGSDYDTSAPPTAYQQSEMSHSHDFAYDQPRRQRRDPSGFSFTQGSEDVISQIPEERRIRGPSTRRHSRRQDRRSDTSPSAPPSAPSSRTSSPRKQRERRSVPLGHFTEPLDFSTTGSRAEYQYSNVDTEDSGTKSYKHPIPGLSKGYRRDGRRSRRRDSLSDSEGETQYS
ncbi:endosomal spry domain-containing protein [Penicillium digitatum]|uniref:Endosomal SPRY domain-containing protein n=3 Tax=Penicillium digitatum TaxID=36651 RepID=K9FIV9_PEND2|nr:hypothetical protein PDIP_78510 [Penicillium digitatum Pd1]EKV06590.1 hypothetical protein PDIP_78510 [Penicillium digitatum Pd1]EKV08157.1 hypothetical protein PDIG_69220 [Penicillium digitatum PHI26]KAG0160975.1 hypothetical protein PDIDSM_8507 [Penicillium digitatum]QQK40747.1 endosomal spry domain-containing protein [Penicillium digitatum]